MNEAGRERIDFLISLIPVYLLPPTTAYRSLMNIQPSTCELWRGLDLIQPGEDAGDRCRGESGADDTTTQSRFSRAEQRSEEKHS